MTKTGNSKKNAPTKQQCHTQGVLNDEQGSCVKEHLAGQIAVEYEIHFDTGLKLPYAFHWNGVKQPDGRVARPKESKQVLTIRALVNEGEQVGIYLGSDASPEFRKELLYPVTVGSHDVKIVIKTKTGRHDDKAEVTLDQAKVATGHGDYQDIYKASLTGDIWMRFSHRYSAGEAATIAQATGEADAGILLALQTIYGGSASKAQGISVQFAGKHACHISFQTGVDSNCISNIKNGYSFGGESLPRVHPKSWIAILQAAREAKISGITITSGWRPMTGKAGHRIGLGLDIKSAKNADGKDVVFDRNHQNMWQNTEEKDAHGEWMQSEHELDQANKKSRETKAAEKNAKGAENKAAAAAEAGKAIKELRDATRLRDRNMKTYRDLHRGGLADNFEQALLKNPLVKQLFAPSVMDENTQDKLEAKLNRNQTSNEITHDNHLHITARDTYLLP